MDLLDRLLGHDASTTRQFLDIASGLSRDQLEREFDCGHRTVRATLEHIVWNVECWLDLMQQRPVRDHIVRGPSIEDLLQRYETASGELFAFSRRIVDDGMLDSTYLDTLDEPPQPKTYGGTILHLATHGMHHRAQLRLMYRLLGLQNLPEGDALSWERLQL
ncbi:DinB family protein [Rubinisphaera margarita]|uniref:DinB family protein n=1 Tax=Rubinisphaera margarita TaxID=2909586 RepID=UPI001EE902B4|nr:DinB family protein [Rubinisphaera margarita]MCG6157205.1 DinB family protein [Rubinisphaera margarita]